MESKALKDCTCACSHLMCQNHHGDDGWVALEFKSSLFPVWRQDAPFGTMMVALPRHVINQPCLQKQVSSGQQVVTDQILVGSHGHPIAETEGAQDI